MLQTQEETFTIDDYVEPMPLSGPGEIQREKSRLEQLSKEDLGLDAESKEILQRAIASSTYPRISPEFLRKYHTASIPSLHDGNPVTVDIPRFAVFSLNYADTIISFGR